MYEINDEKIKELKAKHGTVYLITVEDKQAIFRKPNRREVSYATAAASTGTGEKDPIILTETILEKTFLEGDREILDNDEYFYGAMPVAQQMIEMKQGEIKKL